MPDVVSEDEKVCENCNWYMASHAGTHGYCKALPPVFTHQDEQGRPRFFNPIVSPSSFCSLWAEYSD